MLPNHQMKVKSKLMSALYTKKIIFAGAETPVYLATLPQGSPAGKFFYNKSIIDF